MTMRFFQSIALTLALLCPCPAWCANPLSYFLSFFSSRQSWDLNRDGAIRITLIAPEELGGNVRASLIAADLERIISAETDLPIQVHHERIDTESIMGWFFNPRNTDSRQILTDGSADLLLIAEKHAIVSQYPEFHFEGVRAIANAAKAKKMRCMLLNTSNPTRNFRDRSSEKLTEISYRVGDGCGMEVVPVAPAWITTLKLNRLRGDSPVNACAYAYLAAACVRSTFDNAVEIDGDAFVSDWTTAPLLRELASSAFESVAEERAAIHYKGPFQGVVGVSGETPRTVKIFAPSSGANDPVRRNFDALLNEAGISALWRSPEEWYRNGDDFYDASFDLVFGDTIQIGQLSNSLRYSSFYIKPEISHTPVTAMYTPIPAAETDKIAEKLESALFSGYDYAREHHLRYIPLPLAWAKAVQENGELARDSNSGDWFAYMLSSMLYTTLTGRWQPTTGSEKPLANSRVHPQGFHELCSRIGHDTIIGMASLQNRGNSLIVRCENAIAPAGRPVFAGIRLRDRPAAPVKVLCAIEHPQNATVSDPELIFTPENFNIEQNVRITANDGNVAGPMMLIVRAESEDGDIHNQSDIRKLVFNFNEKRRGAVDFSGHTLPTNAVCRLIADPLPAYPLFIKITQQGFPPQTKILSPEDSGGVPIAFHPTRHDYERGEIIVSVEIESKDLRFDSGKTRHRLKLAGRPAAMPELASFKPEEGVLAGPAFVEVKAKWRSHQPLLHTALFLNRRRIGISGENGCSAIAETAPPPSRLPPGEYRLWSETVTSDLFPVASETIRLTVAKERK